MREGSLADATQGLYLVRRNCLGGFESNVRQDIVMLRNDKQSLAMELPNNHNLRSPKGLSSSSLGGIHGFSVYQEIIGTSVYGREDKSG